MPDMNQVLDGLFGFGVSPIAPSPGRLNAPQLNPRIQLQPEFARLLAAARARGGDALGYTAQQTFVTAWDTALHFGVPAAQAGPWALLLMSAIITGK